MAAVSIIYSSDGESWFNYFGNYLQRVFSEINVESIQDTDLHQVTVPNSKVRNAILKSRVNIFIVSPGYVQFLIANPEITIRDVSNDPRKTVIFLCGTTLDDFSLEDSQGQKVTDRFPRFSKQCLLSYPKHDEMLERVVGLLEPDPRSSRDETTTLGRRGDGEEGKPKSPQHKVNGKKKRKSKSFKFIPNQVHCEGTSVVVISFDEQVASEENEVNVEVEIEGDADADGPTKVMAIWLNPYTYSFTAPERRAGTLKAQLFMTGKIVGSEDLEYSSPMMDAILGLHLIYIRQLNELCSILNENRLLTGDVDKRMSRLLRDETDDMIPVAAFEYFHRVHRFQNSDTSPFELPTMFHLTAKFGLRELGQQLTDLPDARHSYCIYNSDSKLPEEIARSFNHNELATTFENFREGEGDTFQQLYDSYIIMRGSNPVQGHYLNKGVKAEAEASGDEYDYEDVPSELTCVNQFSSLAKNKSSGYGSLMQDYAKAGKLSKNYVDELENPYECRFRLEQLKAPTGRGFIEDGPPTTIPRNQQELIGIMEQVKNKQLTMNDAEVLFKEWQIRHQKKPASIKQKEDQLAKIREETEKTYKKDTFQFPHFLGKKGAVPSNQYIPEIMPGTKQPKYAAVEALKSTKPMKPEASADRSSTTSSSSRESTCSVRSRASTTSGIDIDETIQEEAAPKLLPKPKGNRRSVCLQKLEKELSSPGALEPPPLPPRVLGQPIPRPAIPTPKLNKTVTRAEEDADENSSPEDSYIDCELEMTNVSVTSDDMYMVMEHPGKQSTHENVESPSKSMIHQESMPEFRNPPWSEQPRKCSLPNIANPSSVPIPSLPFCRVPEEAEEGDSSSNSSSTLARQFQLPQEGFKVVLKKVTPQVSQGKPTVPVSTAKPVIYGMAVPKPGSTNMVQPVQPKPKPGKVPPGVPQKNK